MAWTMNGESETNRPRTAARHHPHPRADRAREIHARPEAAAMTAGRTSVTRNGSTPAIPEAAPPTTRKPGLPALTGPGYGMFAGKFPTPNAWARRTRHAYPGESQ